MNRFLGGAMLAFLLAQGGLAAAETFKCDGPDGKPVFGDQRCPPTDEQRLRELEAALKAPGTPEAKASIQQQIDTIRSRAKEAAERKTDKKGERK